MSTNKIRPFVGLILAGGYSSRMGEDKALLEIDGETLLQRNIKLLKQIGATDVFVSRNDFSEGSLPDIYPHQGPLSGVHSALFQSQLCHNSAPIIVLPIDMPLLSEDLLICLVEAGLTMDNAVHYIEHPLPAFIPNSNLTREYLEAILSDISATKPSRSIRRFLTRIDAVQLSTGENDKLINTNTPEQWCDLINSLSRN
ncbi:molybdenum cofactor guanylyltransferase [Psychrosphaera sp. F3M07]|uniref:molybdenum cofactor guanylyltransferase n=1 Tax=Psychrosphaera sp. F3M07 TaxID=2841560 RepID=UPI001C0A6167|nr:molybdenum cofactor guanylyltransferase [Psychrosphaera sp. F3M07]MBU2917014.1 molybdenum cofactor guanylyltransferase [Psychrosphaera sp. F3M07]